MKLTRKIGVGAVVAFMSTHTMANNEGLTIGQSILVDPLIDSVVDDRVSAPAKKARMGQIKSGGVKTAAAETLQADDISLYSIPLSYTLPYSFMGGEEFLSYSAKLPIVNVDEPNVGSKTGLGDISVGVDYIKLNQGQSMELGVGLKLPTGDADDGLGTDSIDFSLSGTLRDQIDAMLGWKASLLYVLRGEGTVRTTKIEYGNSIGLTGGAEYTLDQNLSFTADLVYLMNDGLKFKDFGGGNADIDTLDLVPAGVYTINQALDVKGSIVIPVSESVSGGGNVDRDINFKLSITSEF